MDLLSRGSDDTIPLPRLLDSELIHPVFNDQFGTDYHRSASEEVGGIGHGIPPLDEHGAGCACYFGYS